MNELKSERLLFKKIREGDHENLYLLWHDKDLIKFTYHPYMETLEDAGQRVLRVIAHYAISGGNFGPYLVYHNGQFVGYCGLDHKSETPNEYEIFYIISREYQGQGFGTEVSKTLTNFAFNTLGADRVSAEAVSDNKTSCRILEKTGMVKEGCLRRKFFKGENFHDLMLYGILREEWRKVEGY